MQEEIPNPSPNFLINQTNTNDFIVPTRGVVDELPRPPATSRRTWDSLHFPSLYFFLSFTFYCGNVFRASTFSILQEKRKKKSALVRQQHSVISIPNKGLIHTHTHTHRRTYILLNFSLSMFVIDVVLAQWILKKNQKKNQPICFFDHY